MRCQRPLLSIGILSLVAACQTAAERFGHHENIHRDQLAARYPAGSRWSEPQDKLAPFTTWMAASPAPDWFATRALERARELGHTPASCCHGPVARTSLGTSLGAIGIFHDYVFLDDQARILVAFRRFVD